MRKLLRTAALILLSASAIFPRYAVGQTATAPANDKEEWVTRVFQIQPNFPWWKWWHQINEQNPQIDPAEMSAIPAPSAPKEQWIKQIQIGTAAARKSLGELGESLPQGTAFLYDEQTGTLVARIIKERWPDIELLVSRINHPAERTIHLQLHVLEGPAGEIHQIVADCRTKENHSEELSCAVKRTVDGNWKVVAQSANEIRSGQRMALEAGTEWKAAFTGVIKPSGDVFFETAAQPGGLIFEADPILSPGKTIVDINTALEYHFAPPRHRQEKTHLIPAQSGHSVQLPLADTHFSKIVTSASFRASQSRLLSVWTPTDHNGIPRRGIMQVAFLTPQVNLVYQPLNEKLRDIFLAHVDQAEPISKSAPALKQHPIPPGMQLRSFGVPSDFSSEPQDVFSPERPNASEAKKLLEASGITFPEGSRLYYSSYFTLLTAINTPENLDAIEAFCMPLICRWPKRELLFTAEIIQAEAALVRPILAACAASGDHQKGQLAIESLLQKGQAQRIESFSLPVRSGQRAVFEAGQLLMQPGQVTITEPAPDVAKKDGNQPEPAKITESAKTEISHEVQLSGTRFELDPVLNSMGRAIDLNFTFEYHYAPAELNSLTENQPNQEPVKFHRFKVNTSTTVPLKTSRILGVWKPEGSPEFEGKNLLQAAFFRIDLRLVEHEF